MTETDYLHCSARKDMGLRSWSCSGFMASLLTNAEMTGERSATLLAVLSHRPTSVSFS